MATKFTGKELKEGEVYLDSKPDSRMGIRKLTFVERHSTTVFMKADPKEEGLYETDERGLSPFYIDSIWWQE